MPFETISVIGLGYIGLPTAAMFASRKKKVIGVDVSQKTVNTINDGRVHIVEPDLDIIVHAAVTEGYLKASLTPEPADAFLIAVPTPFLPNLSGAAPEPDLSYIKAAAKSIASVLKKGDLVVLESTSPVGATEQLVGWLSEERPDMIFPSTDSVVSDVFVAHCPERVLPGQVIKELVQNDRVIGGITKKCSAKSVELYKIFVKGECVVTTARTAEMAKLTENASRDVGIAFANELSMICSEIDIDVWELISLANRHPRVNILRPGPGVGGHCIAVDPWFIVSRSPDTAKMIRTARMVNDAKPSWVVDKVKATTFLYLQENTDRSLEDVVIACYGVAFKPNIDDLRESPSVAIAQDLIKFGAGRVVIVEPNIKTLPESLVEGELMSVEEALKCASIHVVLVSHDQFCSITPSLKYLVDVQGIWRE